ncbi:hypothetical protein H5410_060737 [Solanum commersonii]|uniref:Uncharacterized protein n=1 Tax=Solanum commersonii TaxID=4109 RepID=A0A9J5W5V4_SOLCO|nr:hypothetical protein H5410_060737 [Solanum commersonii]
MRRLHTKLIISEEFNTEKLTNFQMLNPLEMSNLELLASYRVCHDAQDQYSVQGDTCCFEIAAPYVEYLTIYGCDELDEMSEDIQKDLLASVRDFHFDVGRGRHLLTIARM